MPALGVTLTKKWSHRAIGQLKNKTKAEWISHLDRDERWERAAQQTGGSPIVFQRVDDKSKTVSIIGGLFGTSVLQLRTYPTLSPSPRSSSNTGSSTE